MALPALTESQAQYPLPQSVLPLPTKRATVSRVHLGNLGIDTYTRAGLLTEILDHALHGTRTRQIVTANAQFYVLADKNVRFRGVVEESEYICADGMPLVWACDRLMHTKVPRIAGIDLIDDLCREGAAKGLRVFFMGGRPGTARATASILATKYPGMVVAGVSCPNYGFELKPETLTAALDEIGAAKPQVLFLALGAPKQEFFIGQHIRPLGIPLAIGIGGSFELLAGDLHRAPRWMQDAGLEWAFRLAQEPRRLWKRYLIGNLEFVWSLTKWSVSRNFKMRGLDQA